jgi:VCBS repeat protein
MRITTANNCLVVSLILFTTASGQTTFGDQNVISNHADGAWSVYAADVDSDGDLDVLSASGFDSKIAWYENDGQAKPNWIEHAVSLDCPNAVTVRATDLDGDGDLDVIAASNIRGTVYWYENDGQVLPGWTEHVISTSCTNAAWIEIADLDGDGDVDVLSASWGRNRIAWYENVGSNVWTDHSISDSCPRAVSVFAVDLNADGYLDVLSASETANSVYWYQSDGLNPPNWTQHLVTNQAQWAKSVYAADLNNDGTVDVLSASEKDDKIAWYLNDGQLIPSFTEFVIATDADLAMSVFALDLDQDDDLDVLSASRADNRITWYENDGATLPGWQVHTLSNDANWAMSVYAADLNGDQWNDVLSASWGDDKIASYLNQGARWFSCFNVLPGQNARLVLEHAQGPAVYFLASATGAGPTYLPGQDLYIDLSPPLRNLGAATPGLNGTAILYKSIPPWMSGYTLWAQALDGPLGALVPSNLVSILVP